MCSPLRGYHLTHATPVTQLHSTPLCPAHRLPRAPATCSGQLGGSQRLHLQPVRGWQGLLAEGTGPRAAGCAADGVAAVCPVEANVSGRWPGPQKAGTGRGCRCQCFLGWGPKWARCRLPSILLLPTHHQVWTPERGRSQSSLSVVMALPAPRAFCLYSRWKPASHVWPSQAERLELAVLTLGWETGHVVASCMFVSMDPSDGALLCVWSLPTPHQDF